jgi:hypothetical protein
MILSDFDWGKPDHWLAAIILDSEGNQVYGKTIDGVALLEGIPHPSTGLNYLDVVEVKKSQETQMYKDDPISIYRFSGIYKKSGNKTFIYEAVIPNYKIFHNLDDWFSANGQKNYIMFKMKFDDQEWLNGTCSAKNIDEARKILKNFYVRTNGWMWRLLGRPNLFRYRNLQEAPKTATNTG